ncbi:DUF2187 family protein [Bacillus sp. V5-8f]|uniref:DUF2187 family protein n=1 Tax=Bacillus sp. V5-8f TaxID=2053044 RepID=UPI000C76D202|nr:DUF2187 family protein [Bacillus sp. V5-8f]PLT33533.1 DUF2187 domain-containing protein [Bacillus sp. V5-8f]
MAEKASVGDNITFHGGIEGTVRTVNENSVIVEITKNNTEEVFGGGVTVINHKNYKIIKK